jgi:hypothetical protein
MRVGSDAGGIGILVNNATVLDLAPVTEVTEKSWDILYAVNAKELFFTLQAVARQMINQGHGGRSRPGSTSSRGINVNGIAPGRHPFCSLRAPPARGKEAPRRRSGPLRPHGAARGIGAVFLASAGC